MYSNNETLFRLSGCENSPMGLKIFFFFAWRAATRKVKNSKRKTQCYVALTGIQLCYPAASVTNRALVIGQMAVVASGFLLLSMSAISLCYNFGIHDDHIVTSTNFFQARPQLRRLEVSMRKETSPRVTSRHQWPDIGPDHGERGVIR
jgi:uncharacterized membrane protein